MPTRDRFSTGGSKHKVALASKISPEHYTRLNLGHLDPATINPAGWQNREDEGILYRPRPAKNFKVRR
jgi:hypothetical protein